MALAELQHETPEVGGGQVGDILDAVLGEETASQSQFLLIPCDGARAEVARLVVDEKRIDVGLQGEGKSLSTSLRM